MTVIQATAANPSRRSVRRGWVAKTSLQAMAVMLATPALAQAQAVPPAPDPVVKDGGGNGGYAITTSTTLAGANVVSSGSQSASNTVYTGYQTTGGAGSGGGAGLGGVFFVDKNASLTLNNVSFSGNLVVGGTGGGAGISSVSPFQATVNASSADASTDKVLLPTFSYGTLADTDPRSQYAGGPAARNALTLDSFTLKTADPLLVKGATAYLGNIATSAAQQAQEGAQTAAPSATITDVITNGDGSVTYKIGQTYTANGATTTGAYVVPANELSTFKLNDPSSGFYGEDNHPGGSGTTFIPPSQILPGTGLAAREDGGPEVMGTINDIKYGSGSNIVGFTLTAPAGTVYPTTVSAPLFNSVEIPRFVVSNGPTDTLTTIGPDIPFQKGMLVMGDGIPNGTTITGVTLDPASQQVTAITLSNNVDPTTIRSFKAAFSPLLNNDTANNRSTIQLASVANLGIGEMVTGNGIAAGAFITGIDQTNNTITINSAIGAAGLTAIGNGGFQVTANPVINARVVDGTGMTYAVLGSATGVQINSILQGTGIPDYAKITRIDGNNVYYVIDPTVANLVKGGSLNGLAATDLTVSTNGKPGNFGSPLNAILGDGEGIAGTNGTNGKASTTTTGGNGGAGGAGSFGSPVNTQLIVANTLDALGIAADIAGIIDDAANPFTEPKAISDGIGLGVDVLGQVNDLVQLAAYTVQLGLGEAGLGGGGGSGGAGGNGGDYFGGGAGGVGGRGGDGALPITDGGAGGDGGTGGKGGFGAGGGSGGEAGLGGANGRSDNGGDGSGGQGGFGGGVGSSGYAGGGGGGSGYGGAIFVRNGGTLTITGNALFEGNAALAGSSNDGGSAGQSAGGDLFMMRGSTVTLQPGVGNTITFTDGIADDSAASIQNASYAAGQGAGLTITGGGLVQFQAANTYTGTTKLQGATLEADQGVGLNVYSQLLFAGTGTISTAGSISEQNAGVLLTSGRFTRSVGAGPTNVAWAGSGGFAATADGLTVNLGQINGGQGPTLTWGVGSFKPSTLVFGSSAADATGAVTFVNGINLAGNAGRIAVYDNSGSTTDRAILTGAITNGSLIVNDANYAGSLYLDGQNALTGIVVQNGLVSTLDGGTVGHLSAAGGASVLVSGGTLLLGGAEQLTTVLVGQPGTLDARGAITAGNIMNAGTILLAAPSSTGTIANAGIFTAAQSVTAGDIANSATGVMSFANGVRAGTIANAGRFSIGGGLSTATNVYNQAMAGTVPVFNQGGALVVSGNALNAGSWILGADLSVKTGTVENDGTLTVTGTLNNGAEIPATRTITAANFTGAATGQIALGGTGATANTLVISQTGTNTYLGTVTGAGNLVVTGGGSLTFGGVLSQAGGLRVQQGIVTLTAADTYQGQTLIDPNGTLALTGQGSIGQSNLTANGLFDISSAAAPGAAIASLSGFGRVQLGGNTLRLNQAAGTFSGQIIGTGGLTVVGGTETLAGGNTYTGATAIQQGATLGLTGTGSIAASSAVMVDGTLAIGATTNGATITTLSGGSTGSVTLGAQALTIIGPGNGDFAGTISGTGNVVVAGGGQILEGVNGYTGRTIIGAPAGLSLVGNGSIAASSGVTADGLFTIQNTNAGASIASLSGAGLVGLGAQTLTLTNAADSFAGAIMGSGGLTVTGGTETLLGRNQYTGQTLIGAGATLGLVGTGSIGASSGVTANGTFAIDQTTGGAVIAALSGAGTGRVALGGQTLAITGGGDFAGVIGGAGNLTIAGGTQVLRGVNGYTGRTTVNGGAALSLAGGGSIAASSGVTDNGVFAIADGGKAITSLSGAGTVQLGGNTLTLTNASETFAGTIGGSGGLTVAGGAEQLSGQNGYTGQTVVNGGATLGLVGTGSVGASSSVVDNGTFTIAQTSNGAAIRSLSGAGQVQLGTQRLALIAAADRFAGTIAGSGGLDLMAGSETLTGANGYTGSTTIAQNATLALAGAGSIAASLGVLDNGTFDITGAGAGVAITTLAGNGAVALGGNRLTLTNASSSFTGVIGGSQGVSIAGGTQVLGGGNSYAGRTQVATGATLALAGNGSIAASAGVDLAGTFDISSTAGGASIASLAGAGTVQLGGMALTLTNAADEFDGIVAGTGTLTVAGGTETLGGVNTYTGLTTVVGGAQLALVGTGSIAASAGLVDNGIFSIAGVTGGSTVQALYGTGQVVLGSQQLTIAGGNSAFAGTFVGTGALTFSGGNTMLSGVSSFTGRTVIAPNTTLALVGAGSLAASSGITDNGTFSIAGASGNESIRSLSGNGIVALGANTLTLTSANDQFAGVIGGTGGLTLAGGSEALSGTNAYTGRTTIAAGATLSLTGGGSIAASGGVTDNGTFAIAGSNAGASIAGLSGNGAVTLGANTLTLTNARDQFAGVIGGSGGLTLAGGGETLAAAQGYTGTTTIGAGASLVLAGQGSVASSAHVVANGLLDLSGAAAATLASLAGTGQVAVGANTLTLTNAGDRFAGAVTGSGGLTVAKGTETLTGANGYTGRTAVNAGATLALAGTGSVAASAGASVAGTLDLTATSADVALNQLDGAGSVVLGAGRLTIGAASGTFGGTVSGAGTLAITGGMMALTGANSYAGGTQVTNAGLTIAADGNLGAAAGPLSLQNAMLTFGGAVTSARTTTLTGGNTINLAGNAVTLNGAIGGSGGLTASGGGSLTLGGANSYAGGTSVNGTTLRIGSDAALGAASGVLMLQNATLQATANVTSARDVLVAGSDRIDGNGNQVSLNGTIYGQSGSSYAAIASGGLRLTGVLTVDPTGFTVTQGALLRGTGTFNRAVTVAGTLAPGNSPGTMTFNAPVTIASTGTLSLDIDGTGTGTGAGNYSRLVLTGTNAFTAGGTLAPVLRGITGAATNSFTPSLGQTFTVVQTNVAVNGKFASIAEPAAGLATGTRFDVLYGNNVTLVVTPSDYGNLTSLIGSGVVLTPNQQAVGASINALRGTPGATTDATTASILTSIYSLRNASDVATLETQLAGEIYTDALRAAAARSDEFSQTVDFQTEGGTRGGGLLWLAGYNRGHEFGSSIDRPTYGLAGGAGVHVGAGGIVGIAGGYDSGRLNFRASNDTAEVKLTHLTGYAGWTGGQFFLRAQAGATRTDIDATRSIGLLGVTARSSGSGWGFAGGGEIGYTATMNGWILQPSILARVSRIRVGALAENGAGPVSLDIDRPMFNEAQGVANLRIGHEIAMANGWGMLRPTLDIGYLRELDDRVATIVTRFAGAPGTPTTIRSIADGRNALRVGAGLSLAAQNGLSVSLRGDLNTQRNIENRSITLGLGWRW